MIRHQKYLCALRNLGDRWLMMMRETVILNKSVHENCNNKIYWWPWSYLFQRKVKRSPNDVTNLVTDSKVKCGDHADAALGLHGWGRSPRSPTACLYPSWSELGQLPLATAILIHGKFLHISSFHHLDLIGRLRSMRHEAVKCYSLSHYDICWCWGFELIVKTFYF